MLFSVKDEAELCWKLKSAIIKKIFKNIQTLVRRNIFASLKDLDLVVAVDAKHAYTHTRYINSDDGIFVRQKMTTVYPSGWSIARLKISIGPKPDGQRRHPISRAFMWTIRDRLVELVTFFLSYRQPKIEWQGAVYGRRMLTCWLCVDGDIRGWLSWGCWLMEKLKFYDCELIIT